MESSRSLFPARRGASCPSQGGLWDASRPGQQAQPRAPKSQGLTFHFHSPPFVDSEASPQGVCPVGRHPPPRPRSRPGPNHLQRKPALCEGHVTQLMCENLLRWACGSGRGTVGGDAELAPLLPDRPAPHCGGEKPPPSPGPSRPTPAGSECLRQGGSLIGLQEQIAWVRSALQTPAVGDWGDPGVCSCPVWHRPIWEDFAVRTQQPRVNEGSHRGVGTRPSVCETCPVSREAGRPGSGWRGGGSGGGRACLSGQGSGRLSGSF